MEQNLQFENMQYYIEKVRLYNEEFSTLHGRQPVVYTRTYGCQQNVSDSEKLKGLLTEMGYTHTEDATDVDLILFNTCAVRENAEERVFGNVGALKHAKRRNPNLIIGICGCMIQQEHIAEKVKKSFPYVDLVFGTHALPRFPELLYLKLSGQKRIFDIAQSDGMIVEDIPLRRDGTTKAWLPIMYGCNNFCTYCVVPFVRGRERSREPEHILNEARQLIDEGYKEITLLGQNVNSYGKTLEQPISFSTLLRQLNSLDGDFLIRFMTSHPKDCTYELIDTIATCEKVANHLHLPVQSGSNRILKAMNRSYSREQYLDLIAYAKKRIPGITFTSDIIVGFPGETYEDFMETLSLIREVNYLSLFTFVYSKRQGTKAASMEDPISKKEKMRWFQELLDLQESIGMRKHASLEGTVLRVLAEGPGKTGEEYLTGRSESNIIVDFAADQSAVGQFVTVKITKAMRWALLGEAISI